MKTTITVLAWFSLQFVFMFSSTWAAPFPDPEKAAADATTYTNQANDLLQHASSPKEFQDAAWLLESAIKADPANDDTRITLGWVYLDKLHEPRKAYPYLAVAAERRPNDANARKLFGMACSQTGRTRQAVKEFTQASLLQPGNLWVQANLARSLARLGHYREAGQIYAQILATDPGNTEARLGQAELAAWRGQSTAPLETLGTLTQENPTNAEALTLAGDIHRWNWDLSEARHDYQQALAVVPNDYEARTGLAEADKSGASSLTFKAYDFLDTTDFRRDSAGLDTRVHLADHAYLLAGADGWRFTAPGFSRVYRVDEHAGLEVDWNRWLTTTAEGTAFEYEHQNARFGGDASLKLSPTPRVDIYASGAYQQPFASSMSTVSNQFKQNSASGGFDIRLPGRFPIQDSAEVARISDGNTWWEEKPQLSFRLFDKPATFLRAQYDYLTYRQSKTTYWTPQHRSTVGPVLDSSIPLFGFVRIDLNAQAPYVFDASRFGFIGTAGPTFEFSKWVELNASYTYAHIPADRSLATTPPWSGHGGQAYLRVRF